MWIHVHTSVRFLEASLHARPPPAGLQLAPPLSHLQDVVALASSARNLDARRAPHPSFPGWGGGVRPVRLCSLAVGSAPNHAESPAVPGFSRHFLWRNLPSLPARAPQSRISAAHSAEAVSPINTSPARLNQRYSHRRCFCIISVNVT